MRLFSRLGPKEFLNGITEEKEEQDSSKGEPALESTKGGHAGA